ncbi:phage holin family protein [Pseudanabaena sp. FACHB-2040]|uniref:phage holin family protein n=1 Tax=Pseudanabaena sp. FACHB-2040 TaxID=2692859 RepID=UPI001682704A|nr:phage holin family protein [Pseudanabaena sp. FACHB-2040]MBD0269563.1 phage holin family protein [Cyanobacteria bacterium Co-bin8]MBD2260956.1 phage holin family protein [Pseudanabaena sp. FACHB-2040]
MGFITSFLIIAVVTAISLLIISKIPPLGVEVVSFSKALQSGIVFGILNGVAGFIFQFLGWPLFVVLTLGFSLLILLLINVIVFSLTAKLVEGFSLRYGIWSAVLGAIALSFVNGVIFWLLGQFGVTVA